MGLMPNRDYSNYASLFELMERLVSPPDLLIYLKADMPKLVDQIQKRGRDFEDAIQHQVALENGQSVLITRNLKDYRKANCLIMSPEMFLAN